jgi:hypothetical protein
MMRFFGAARLRAAPRKFGMTEVLLAKRGGDDQRLTEIPPQLSGSTSARVSVKSQ